MAIVTRPMVLALAILASSTAAAAEWRNGEGGRFTFETRFEGESLKGSFDEFDLVFDFAPEQPESAHLTVTVALAAADLGDPDMNAVLFDKAWFNIERYSQAVFESASIVARSGQAGSGQDSSGQAFLAKGVLKLKGVEKAVSVPFIWRRNGMSAQMSGAVDLARTDFDVGTGEWSTGDSVGLTVRLKFDIPLVPGE